MLWFVFVGVVPIVFLAAGFHYGGGGGSEMKTRRTEKITIEAVAAAARAMAAEHLESRQSPRALSWHGRHQRQTTVGDTSDGGAATLARQWSWHASPRRNETSSPTVELLLPAVGTAAAEQPEIHLFMPGAAIPGHSLLERRTRRRSHGGDGEILAGNSVTERCSEGGSDTHAGNSTSAVGDIQQASKEFQEVRPGIPVSTAGNSLVRRRSLRHSHENVSERIGSEELVAEQSSRSNTFLPSPAIIKHRETEDVNQGREGESASASLTPRGQESVNRNAISQNPLATNAGRGQEFVAIRVEDETQGRSNIGDATSIDHEADDTKSNLRLCYFATGIAGTGIIGVYSGYLQNPTGHVNFHYLGTCTFLMLASFISGASLIVLTSPCRLISVPPQIIQTLKYTTLGYLTLALIDISYMFLNIYVIPAILIAFLPAVLRYGYFHLRPILRNPFRQR